MSESFTCPFCNHTMPLLNSTFNERKLAFHTPVKMGYVEDDEYCFTVQMFKCPNCQKITSFAIYSGSEMPEKSIPLFPISMAMQFPDYIPEVIRQDYEEAYVIASLSPKASATLSRRCIQGMIHDKWNIKLKNLNQEITALKDEIEPTLWSAIDSLRQLGNIGAHMEKDINVIVDIDSGEAEKLIKLVEILIKEWYIIPHERNELFSDIIQMNTVKQNQRKKTE